MSFALFYSNMHSLLLCGFRVVPIQFFNCGYSISTFDNLAELKTRSNVHSHQAVIVIRASKLHEETLKNIYSLNQLFKSAQVIVMTSMGNVGFSSAHPSSDSLFFYSEDDIGGVKALVLKLRENAIAFKRRHVRAPVDINATVITEVVDRSSNSKIQSPPNRATICDLSMSGAGLLVEGIAFEKDQPVKVVMLLGARDRKEFTGTIRWTHKVDQRYYRLGIEFNEAA